MLGAGAAAAGPWAAPGDARLRHDLQLLNDAGIFHTPLTTWPLSWGEIARNFRAGNLEEITAPELLAAYFRVKDAMRENAADYEPDAEFALEGATTPRRFRTFADTPRARGEASLALSWMTHRFALRLEGAALSRPADGRRWRWDGSYAGATLGNWMFSIGAMDRWWGPGRDGSLILSTNARPVPAVAVQRNYATPFELPVLEWLGPWNLTLFNGRLEGERHVPHAMLLGMRLTFRPVRGLEIGLSRTAQWGGAGRPTDLDTFLNLLVGHDNRGNNGITFANEPGNQLGGVDVRWASPLGDLPYALYTQWIGEDEAGMWPSRYIALGGLEFWGALGRDGASWRLHAEYADTLVGFYKARPHYNLAYSHANYRSGYRYRGRALGHAMDADGRMLSVGGRVVDEYGRSLALLVRRVEPNRDAANRERLLALELRGRVDTDYGEFEAGAEFLEQRFSAAPDARHVAADLRWRYRY